jgi:calpain-15
VSLNIEKGCCAFLCCVCFCCRSCCTYKDDDFPADATSLGAWHGKSAAQLDKEVEWQTSKQIFNIADDAEAEDKQKLFEDKIEPSDVAQGQLGNCWLISAIACLAEFPGAIQNCFLSKFVSPRGKYKVRLFSKQDQKWIEYSISDCFPVKKASGKPLFAQPNGKELWGRFNHACRFCQPSLRPCYQALTRYYSVPFPYSAHSREGIRKAFRNVPGKIKLLIFRSLFALYHRHLLNCVRCCVHHTFVHTHIQNRT